MENIVAAAIAAVAIVLCVEMGDIMGADINSRDRMSIQNRKTIFGKIILILFRSIEGIIVIAFFGFIVNMFWLGAVKLTGINVNPVSTSLLTLAGIAVFVFGVLLYPKFQNKISKKEAKADNIKSALEKLVEIVNKKQSQQEENLSRLSEICERLEKKLETPVQVSVKLLKK